MRETMVRTQVYLPRDVYQRLQKRAAENDLTLAVQIREALEDWIIRPQNRRRFDVSSFQIIDKRFANLHSQSEVIFFSTPL